MITVATREDDFDAMLVAELKTLRDREQHLQQLFSRLKRQPQLRDRFLVDLAALRQRTERLDAVLNPLQAFHSAGAFAAPTLTPAA